MQQPYDEEVFEQVSPRATSALDDEQMQSIDLFSFSREWFTTRKSRASFDTFREGQCFLGQTRRTYMSTIDLRGTGHASVL